MSKNRDPELEKVYSKIREDEFDPEGDPLGQALRSFEAKNSSLGFLGQFFASDFWIGLSWWWRGFIFGLAGLAGAGIVGGIIEYRNTAQNENPDRVNIESQSPNSNVQPSTEKPILKPGAVPPKPDVWQPDDSSRDPIESNKPNKLKSNSDPQSRKQGGTVSVSVTDSKKSSSEDSSDSENSKDPHSGSSVMGGLPVPPVVTEGKDKELPPVAEGTFTVSGALFSAWHVRSCTTPPCQIMDSGLGLNYNKPPITVTFKFNRLKGRETFEVREVALAADGSYTLSEVPGGTDVWLQVKVPGFLRKSISSPLNLKNNIVQVDFVGIKPGDYNDDGEVGDSDQNHISEWKTNCFRAIDSTFPDSRYDRLCDYDFNDTVNMDDDLGYEQFHLHRADD